MPPGASGGSSRTWSASPCCPGAIAKPCAGWPSWPRAAPGRGLRAEPGRGPRPDARTRPDPAPRVSDRPVVLITGATGGIGRAVALAYARRGARLVLLARSPGLLADLVRACERRDAPAVD